MSFKTENRFLHFSSYRLIIDKKSPQDVYQKVDINKISRKENLLYKIISSEINFLNIFFEVPKDKKAILLYIGPIVSKHIYKIAQLYPELEYHVYCGTSDNKSTENLLIYDRDFSEQEIPFFQNPNFEVYVITNFTNPNIKSNYEIKNSENPQKYQDEKETLIENDMLLQMNWMELLKPKVACLKFRLPKNYNISKSEFQYFKGLVYAQIFSGYKSTECKMVVRDFSIKSFWFIQKFNDQMNYYNNVVRETSLFNPVSNNKLRFKNYGNKMKI